MSASPPPPPALPRALPPASPLAATAPLWLALVAATACICCVCQRKSPPRAKSGSTSPLQHSAQARGLSTREVAGPHATHAASRSMAATQETKRAPSPHVKSPLLPPHAVPAGGASWSAKSVPVPDAASILLDELSTLRELPSTSPEPASSLQIAHSPTLVPPSTLQIAHLHLPEAPPTLQNAPLALLEAPSILQKAPSLILNAPSPLPAPPSASSEPPSELSELQHTDSKVGNLDEGSAAIPPRVSLPLRPALKQPSSKEKTSRQLRSVTFSSLPPERPIYYIDADQVSSRRKKPKPAKSVTPRKPVLMQWKQLPSGNLEGIVYQKKDRDRRTGSVSYLTGVPIRTAPVKGTDHLLSCWAQRVVATRSGTKYYLGSPDEIQMQEICAAERIQSCARGFACRRLLRHDRLSSTPPSGSASQRRSLGSPPIVSPSRETSIRVARID